MKAITVRNPYAWAIAMGVKDVENRSRSVSYRGDIAIHAGLAWHDAGNTDPAVIAAWLRWYGSEPDPSDINGCFGRVVAIAELHDCHAPSPGCCGSPWAQPDASAHLLLRNIYRLKYLVPAKGALGVWTLPEDVAAAVARPEVPA